MPVTDAERTDRQRRPSTGWLVGAALLPLILLVGAASYVCLAIEPVKLAAYTLLGPRNQSSFVVVTAGPGASGTTARFHIARIGPRPIHYLLASGTGLFPPPGRKLGTTIRLKGSGSMVYLQDLSASGSGANGARLIEARLLWDWGGFRLLGP